MSHESPLWSNVWSVTLLHANGLLVTLNEDKGQRQDSFPHFSVLLFISSWKSFQETYKHSHKDNLAPDITETFRHKPRLIGTFRWNQVTSRLVSKVCPSLQLLLYCLLRLDTWSCAAGKIKRRSVASRRICLAPRHGHPLGRLHLIPTQLGWDCRQRRQYFYLTFSSLFSLFL